MNPFGPDSNDLLTEMSINFSMRKLYQEQEKFKNWLVHRNQHAKLPDCCRIQLDRVHICNRKCMLKFSFLKTGNEKIKIHTYMYITSCFLAIHGSWFLKIWIWACIFHYKYASDLAESDNNPVVLHADSDPPISFGIFIFLGTVFRENFSQREVDGHFYQ